MSYIPDLGTIIASIEQAFQLVFPEYPAVGVAVCLLSLFLFGFYFLRADLTEALKVSCVTFCIMIFTLYCVHTLDRLISL